MFSILVLFFISVVHGRLSLESIRAQLDNDARMIQPYNAALNCTDVKLPPKMCPKCHLRKHDSEGNFNRDYNKDIIDFETPECLEQLELYVRLNPCDDLRAKYLSEYKTNSFAWTRIAQFMYSVCEQCCDCVTVGSKPNEYTTRKEDATLYKLTRGNCPAHFHYDICKMFPNFTRFITPNQKVRKNKPRVCPEVAKWIESDDAKNWSRNPDADGLSDLLVNTFGRTIQNARCRNRRVWQDCVRLERAQGRV